MSALPMDLSHIKLVVFDFDGVLTDNRVLVMQDGSEGVFCSRGDGFGTQALQKVGIHTLVVSTEKNPVVGERCKKLGLNCVQNCDNKQAALIKEAKKLNLALKDSAYLGNDINDIECMKLVGLPACVQDSHPDVFPYASYITEKKGGYGAVREFCEYVLAPRKIEEILFGRKMDDPE